MFEKFDEGARRSLCYARYEAARHGKRSIEAADLLVGVAREGGDLSRELGLGAVREHLSEPMPAQPATSHEMPLDDGARRVVQAAIGVTRERVLAMRESVVRHYEAAHRTVTVALSEESSAAIDAIAAKLKLGVPRDAYRQTIVQIVVDSLARANVRELSSLDDFAEKIRRALGES